MTQRRFAHGSNIDIERRRCNRLLFFDSHNEAIFANGKADSGCRHFRTQTFRKPVVPTTAEDRILSTKSTMSNFKCGSRVVVEAAHKARSNLKWNMAFLQVLADLFKVFAAGSIEIIENRRKRVDDGLIFRYFAIEHAKWIHDSAALAIGAHLRRQILQPFPESVVESGAAVLATDG